MRHIKTIDDITKDGTVEFGEGYDFVEKTEDADAILMRSTDLHGYELPQGIRAIARCGAGVNNIPVDEYAKKGVVVFNSPAPTPTPSRSWSSPCSSSRAAAWSSP